MIRLRAIPWLALFCCQLAGGASLSLKEAVEQALAGNPDLGVSQAQSEVAQGQVTQAGLRPNPRLTVQTEDIRSGTAQTPFSFANSTEDYLLIGQTIEVAGKRAHRKEVASAGLDIAEEKQNLTRRQLVTRVSAAYWSAAFSHEIRALTQQSLQTYEEDVDYIRNRVKEGVAPEGDLIRIQIERDRIKAALLQLRRDGDQAMVNLFRAMGKTEFPETVLSTGLDHQSVEAIPAVEQVLESRREVVVARKAIEQAESNLKLQQSYAKPDPQVFLGYKRNTGFDTAYAAVQLDLPIHNRNQGNIASAQAEVRLAKSTLELIVRGIRADYEAAARAYRDQQELATMLPAVVAQAQDAERRARAAYREGALELLRLLDAERSRIQTEIDYQRALADLQQSIIGLRLASGADLEVGLNQ